MQEEARGLPRIRNIGALVTDITTADYNDIYLRKKFLIAAHFTRYQDHLLGGNHEFKGGMEFEDAYADVDRWRRDNLIWYWWRDDPYYYGTTTWNGVPDVGKGRIHFSIFGQEESSSKLIYKTRRIGAYIQDSVSFADRLTLNIGLRFDRSWGWMPASAKGICGNAVSIYVGENFVKPYTAEKYPETFTDGINPFGQLSTEEWNDIMVWNAFSPRFGLTFDIFGNKKTVLKASFSRYSEYLMIQYFSWLHPFYNLQSPQFYWYDMNFNKEVDTDDDFEIYPDDYRAFDAAFSANMIDPDIKSPLTDEWTVGLWHEILENFSLGVNFLFKNKKNIVENALYNPDANEWWYHIDQTEAKKYWVPFTAVVPSEDYGDQTVTVYFMKNNAPDFFYRVSNIPELERKYWALEFLFDKRMSKGWQFSGSIVYSKAYGNIGVWGEDTAGRTYYADTPNEFVNTYGRLGVDRPLQVKLMGTVKLPYGIFLSGYYRFFSGWPWIRSAYIVPPWSWCQENDALWDYYWVNIDDPAQPHRGRSSNSLDLRLEKRFRIGESSWIGIYVDAFNVLGWSEVDAGLNDVMYYYPVAEKDNTGLVIPPTSYKMISSVRGTREFSFSIRLTF
jgi:hypothetical protein